MNISGFLRNFTRTRATMIFCALLIAGIGSTILVSHPHALTPAAEIETEDGALMGCAIKTTDSTASLNSATMFKMCSDGNSLSDPTNLNTTGATIPDTNYAVPSGAIFMATNGNDSNAGTESAPVKSLDVAVGKVPTNGTIVVRGGTYRDMYTGGQGNNTYKIAPHGFTLQAYPHEKVWFDGSDVITSNSWTSDGNGHWYMNWNTPQFCDGKYYDFPYNNQSKTGNLTGSSGRTYTTNTGPCTHWDSYGTSTANFPAAGDPQNLFVDGNRMSEVESLNLATSGSFYYDLASKKIYTSTNPSGHTIELSVRPVAIVGGGPGTYDIKGIGFRRYASNQYENLTAVAVYLSSTDGSSVENSTFTQMSGGSLYVKPKNGSVRHSVFAYNGGNGMGGNGSSGTGTSDNALVEGNLFNYNNLENYDRNCSLSCASANLKFAHMVNFTIRNNIFENGQYKTAGIWCDTDCSGGIIVNNLVQNNGGSGIFYEIDSNGIIASNVVINSEYCINAVSVNVKIYNNTLVNCPTIAIRIFDDSRPQQTANIDIKNNVISGKSVNTNWFANSGGQVGADSFITGFDYNSYWRPSTYTQYRWITTNNIDKSYSSTAAFRADLPAWETHATDYVGSTDPFFVNGSNSDYRIRSDSVAYHSSITLPDDVANALGLSQKNGYSRGAISWPSMP